MKPLIQLLITRTEGHPFFQEESVRTLVETGALVGERGAYHLTQALPTIQAPATVQAVLAARIDRLPPEAKHVQQTAAVIGTEAPCALLQTIAELPEAVFHGALMHLQTAEFLYETQLFPEHVYTFKHALTHEVAYGGLLQERRRALHARIVTALEMLAGDRLADHIDRLAAHTVRGEAWDKVLLYCRQAGVKAMERSAAREALAFFEHALAALRQLPETRNTHEQAIDVLLNMSQMHLVLGEAADRRLQLLQEAERLAESLDDPRRLGRLSNAMADYFAIYGPQYDHAIAYSYRALTLAATSKDIGIPVRAHIQLGQVHFFKGDYRQAMGSCRQAMAMLEGEQRYALLGMARMPAVFSRTYLCYALAAVGECAEGFAIGAEGLQLAEVVKHPRGLVQACHGIGYLYVHKGDVHQALPVLERALSLCEDMELFWDFPLVAECLGSAYVLSGRADGAVRLLERALEQTYRSGRAQSPRRLLPLSEAYLGAGRFEEASTLADRALKHARIHQERGSEADALRLLGDIALRRHLPDTAQAEAYYRQARALAEELGMRPLQAHCHAGRGALYAQTGCGEQARTALAAALALYRAMGMTFWLPQTEIALAQVR